MFNKQHYLNGLNILIFVLMNDVSNKIAQFNSSAASYDEDFTLSTIGKLQRDRVYCWLNKIEFFSNPKKVYEINCGTGYDAEQFYQKGHQVMATDVADEMINYARKHRNQDIHFETQFFQEVSMNNELVNYNVLFSNFGGLNCIDEEEFTVFFNSIASKQKKGNQLILVLMSKKCMIESIYFFLKGKFSLMNRRNTNKGLEVTVKNEKVKTYYYLPKEVEDILKPNYNIKLIKPVSCFLPPSYLEPFFKRHQTLLYVLNKLEQILGRFTFMAKWADHYIIVAEKQ